MGWIGDYLFCLDGCGHDGLGFWWWLEWVGVKEEGSAICKVDCIGSGEEVMVGVIELKRKYYSSAHF